MRILTFTLVFLLFNAISLGQALFQHKHLAFAQVAVGETIETLITVTNRGSATYFGRFIFRNGGGRIWNPVVNGQTITYGEMRITISPGSTSTLRITGTQLEGGTVALISDDLSQNNFVEGNLTYSIRSGSSIVDSIAVPPSTEFYLASIPFDDLSTVALALANADFYDFLTADISLTLFSPSGSQIATTTLSLPALSHIARFLTELFPGTNLGQGRLDIKSERPIFGVALTLVQNQLSTLPLLPSPTSYAIRTTSSLGTVSTGEVSLWAEGFFVKGFLRITSVDGTPIKPTIAWVTGRLINGYLRLSFDAQGEAFAGEAVTLYMEHRNFSFSSSSVSGSSVMTLLSDNSTVTGTFELNKTN